MSFSYEKRVIRFKDFKIIKAVKQAIQTSYVANVTYDVTYVENK